MSPEVSKQPHVVLEFKKKRYRLSWKIVAAVLLGVIVVYIGVVNTPEDESPFKSLAFAVSGILGIVMGVLLQPEQLPPDHTAAASSAVRGLLEIADSVDNVQRLTTQLAALSSNQRIANGLVNAQDDLLAIRSKLYRSMSEWDEIAPGATNEVKRLNDAGQKAFDRLKGELDE